MSRGADRHAGLRFTLKFYTAIIVILILAAVVTHLVLSAREDGAVVVTGTIIENQTRTRYNPDGPDRTVHRPLIEFTDEAGNRHVFKGDDRAKPYRVGGPAEVHYRPGDPEGAWHADTDKPSVIPTIMLGMAGLFLIVGIVASVQTWRRDRRLGLRTGPAS